MICINRKICLRSLKDFSKGFCGVQSKNTRTIQEIANDGITKKPESETVFLSKETKVNAAMHEGKVSFNIQFITKTNSRLFRYDYYKWVEEFIEKISHRHEMEQSQLEVRDLRNKLEIIRQKKVEKEAKLQHIQKKLSQCSLEKSIELSHENTSINSLRLVARGTDLEAEERLLVFDIKTLNEKEQKLFYDFLFAIENSYDKSYLHSDFLKASIFTCSLLTLLFVFLGMYIYNYNLVIELKRAADKIKDLKEQMHRKVSNNMSQQKQQSWGSYLNGYVRPLYSWAWPKK